MSNPGETPISKIFALPLRLGSGTRNEAPIFDRHGELVGECVDDDCDERALAFIRAVNSHEEISTTGERITIPGLQATIRILRLSLEQERKRTAVGPDLLAMLIKVRDRGSIRDYGLHAEIRAAISKADPAA